MFKRPKRGAADHAAGAGECPAGKPEKPHNYCTNPDCEKHINLDLPDDAEFCPLCGVETANMIKNNLNPGIR